MADFAYGADVQNQIAYALFGGAYSSLTTDQKTALDGNLATSPPTKGFALLAWQQVGQIAQWWYQAGAGVTPDVWQHWFVARACKLMAACRQGGLHLLQSHPSLLHWLQGPPMLMQPSKACGLQCMQQQQLLLQQQHHPE